MPARYLIARMRDLANRNFATKTMKAVKQEESGEEETGRWKLEIRGD